MKFEGHLTVDREHLVQRIRFQLPDKVERDGFMVIGAAPLRARHRLGWFPRFRAAMRVGGGGKLVRQAREVRFAFPLSGSGRLDYFIDVPNLGRTGFLIVFLAGLLAYFQDSLTTTVFATLFTFAALAIGIHYLTRKSVIAYLGLAPGQFANHRLTMG